MKEHILEESLMSANSVASVLYRKELWEDMREPILEKSLTNVNSVASVLVEHFI